MTSQNAAPAPVAVVSGAARGIGAAISRQLAIDGYAVVAADRSTDEMPRLQLEAGTVTPWHLNVADDLSWARLTAELVALGSAVDVVVNNAYFSHHQSASEALPQDWMSEIEVCLGQVQRSVHHLGRLLAQAAAPSLVNISSVHAAMSQPRHSAYAAAKGGIEALTRQLATECGPHLRVNAVAPGAIQTDAWATVTKEQVADAVARIPLARMGDPTDIAAAVAFLVSPRASYITGTVLTVDGGWLAFKGV